MKRRMDESSCVVWGRRTCGRAAERPRLVETFRTSLRHLRRRIGEKQNRGPIANPLADPSDCSPPRRSRHFATFVAAPSAKLLAFVPSFAQNTLVELMRRAQDVLDRIELV